MPLSLASVNIGSAPNDGTGDPARTAFATLNDNMAAIQALVNANETAVAAAVDKALFDANTILAANSDNTPAPLTVGEQTLVGRITGGSIGALTATQVRTLLNVADGATDDTAADAAQATADAALPKAGGTMTGDITFAGTQTFDGRDVSADGAKLDFLSVTQAVDLDAIETRVNELDAAVVLKGTWDASVGTFPGGGTAQAGEAWIVSVGGTVDGEVFTANDRIVAITDNASTATYAANWHKLDYTDAVLSVAGLTGAISASGLRTAINVEDGATADQSDSEIETAYNAQVAGASQAEMETGTEAGIRRMSPLGVAQAIAALAGGGIADVVDDTSPTLGGDLDVGAFKIFSAGANNIVFKLPDNAGVRKFSVQDSDNAEVAYINSNGEVGARYLRSPGLESTRYFDVAQEWVSDLQIKIKASIVSLTNSGSNNQYVRLTSATKIDGGGFLQKFTTHYFNDLEIGNAEPSTDLALGRVTIKGASAPAAAVTNLIGADVYMVAGDGASGSAGAAHGGDVFLTPGTGFGTGRHGLVIIDLAKIPTADPGVNGALWLDAGVPAISGA